MELISLFILIIFTVIAFQTHQEYKHIQRMRILKATHRKAKVKSEEYLDL